MEAKEAECGLREVKSKKIAFHSKESAIVTENKYAVVKPPPWKNCCIQGMFTP